MTAGEVKDSTSPPRGDPWWQDWPVANHPPNAKTLVITGCGIIYEVPGRPNEVVKVPKPFDYARRDHGIERRVYRRLGSHPNLVEVVEMDQYGIYLARASHGGLREYYLEGGNATVRERIVWCRDVARVLDYVHQNNIRHADLSGRNLLLGSERNILLCDFAGSSIDGDKATILAESGFRHPEESEYAQPTIRAEIHALGSTMYEIITGSKPYKGLEDHVIDKLIGEGRYPNVDGVVLGDIMTKCWRGCFDSAAEVAEEIARSNPKHFEDVYS